GLGGGGGVRVSVSAAGRAALAGLVALGPAVPRLAAAPAPSRLQRALDAIVDAPRFGQAWWGVEVRSLRTGRVLYGRNPQRNVKPASTLKLVTTAAALDAFGPEARLRTTVESVGRLDGRGRILGDLYLVGRGDPQLSGRSPDGRPTEGSPTAAFEEMAQSLRQAGVRRVEGRVVGHEGLFPGDRRGEDWSWGDLVWGYGAEVSALSFNDNVATLTVSPGEREGDPVMVERTPATSYHAVVSTAVTGGSGGGRDLVLRRELGTNVVLLSGSLPAGSAAQVLSVAVEDPARYAATVFAEVLAAKGIAVTGGVDTSIEPLPAGARVLAAHESPPMAEIVKVVNKVSQNLHAEMLLRLLGAQVKADGSAEGGRAALDDVLDRLKVRAESWVVQDGSGLSRSDLVTPQGMVDLLLAMDRHPHAAAFRASLALAGEDGTLASRLAAPPARGRVSAKTGSIRHVNALAGYVTARSGERLAFYVAVNHHTGPASESVAAIDAIVSVLASQ
ncbi:MAG TPA: D-alanyl-D-alanine carboxypeptidase/D-alanyl-D-alanine-endopeptidase, partial [Vicinamibacteria bacterium]|nr:D-alanyl-D-alanine carboxypeptidase/D-alanyl-D-alanine-endopeptidase [Vicinamibacteria bacterium]